MSNPRELFHDDGRSAGVWYCDNCRCVAKTLDGAEACCVCRRCGRVEEHITICRACSDTEMSQRGREHDDKRLARARRYTTADYPSDAVFSTNEGETLFYELGDFLDHCRDLGRPEPAWICRHATPQLDVERVMEDFGENLELRSDISAADVVEDYDGLVAALRAWNEKQKPSIYYPGDESYVDVTDGDLREDDE